MSTRPDRTTLLRRSLQVDGIASGLCGVMLILAAQPISGLIGLSAPRIAVAVGAMLLIYATTLLRNASRATIGRGEALLPVVLNAAWVAGSMTLILAGPLTPLGNAVVVALAAAVLVFAVLETVGLRRLQEV